MNHVQTSTLKNLLKHTVYILISLIYPKRNFFIEGTTYHTEVKQPLLGSKTQHSRTDLTYCCMLIVLAMIIAFRSKFHWNMFLCPSDNEPVLVKTMTWHQPEYGTTKYGFTWTSWHLASKFNVCSTAYYVNNNKDSPHKGPIMQHAISWCYHVHCGDNCRLTRSGLSICSEFKSYLK